MKCFTHTDSEAVGICKSCQKGICKVCAIELSTGLSCHDCNRVKAIHPASGVTFWAICSIILWISFLISYLVYDDFELTTFSFSIISTVILVIASYDLSRKQ